VYGRAGMPIVGIRCIMNMDYVHIEYRSWRESVTVRDIENGEAVNTARFKRRCTRRRANFPIRLPENILSVYSVIMR